MDANNLETCDWAIICGFRRGVGEKIRNGLDLEFYSALENEDYGYLNVLPHQYFVHLEQDYCPLDVIVIDNIKATPFEDGNATQTSASASLQRASTKVRRDSRKTASTSQTRRSFAITFPRCTPATSSRMRQLLSCQSETRPSRPVPTPAPFLKASNAEWKQWKG